MFLSVLRHSWATGMVTETVLKIIGEENVSGQPTFTEKMAVKMCISRLITNYQ